MYIVISEIGNKNIKYIETSRFQCPFWSVLEFRAKSKTSQNAIPCTYVALLPLYIDTRLIKETQEIKTGEHF